MEKETRGIFNLTIYEKNDEIHITLKSNINTTKEGFVVAKYLKSELDDVLSLEPEEVFRDQAKV